MFFIHAQENPNPNASSTSIICFQVPEIDLEGFESSLRKEISDIGWNPGSSATWGFFQVVNHGVPVCIMDGILEGVRQLHEQPKDLKMDRYSPDYKQPVRYFCNGDLVNKGAANWRDSRLWGLHSDYLANICCMETESLVCHYYPACPEPNLTLGATKHSDPSFLTILLQANIRGLQFLHQSNWVDVPSLSGAFIINIGGLIRVLFSPSLAHHKRQIQMCGASGASRTSTKGISGVFFYPSTANKFKPYAPIKEHLTESNPPTTEKLMSLNIWPISGPKIWMETQAFLILNCNNLMMQ
ncbi:hypothetical protein CRYUN_Cryun20dG0083000 [Craigia yunnanensis]